MPLMNRPRFGPCPKPSTLPEGDSSWNKSAGSGHPIRRSLALTISGVGSLGAYQAQQSAASAKPAQGRQAPLPALRAAANALNSASAPNPRSERCPPHSEKPAKPQNSEPAIPPTVFQAYSRPTAGAPPESVSATGNSRPSTKAEGSTSTAAWKPISGKSANVRRGDSKKSGESSETPMKREAAALKAIAQPSAASSAANEAQGMGASTLRQLPVPRPARYMARIRPKA